MSSLLFEGIIENAADERVAAFISQFASGNVDISQLPGDVSGQSLSIAWNQESPAEIQIESSTSTDFEFFDALYALFLEAGVCFKTAKLFDSATGSYHAWQLSIDPDEIDFSDQHVLLVGEFDDKGEIEELLGDEEAVIQQQLDAETTLVIQGASADPLLLKEIKKREIILIDEDQFWDCMQAF